jgi:hypothetical protein
VKTTRRSWQGWAIVDNTVGEDWTDVELSLVAGAPQSFVQQISQPFYARRPVVPLPQTVLFAPQTHEATLQGTAPVVDVLQNRQAVEFRTGAGGGAGTGAPGGVPGGVVGGVPGSVPGEVVRDVARSVMATPPPPAAAASPAARQASVVVAEAQEMGDLFEYRLSQPVTIRTNQSALVPIANAPVEATRVSLWNRGQASGRPLRAVWLTNTSGLTLDGGTFSVIDGGAFAGEGLVDPLRPGERRLLSYGSDLAVMVDSRLDDSSGRYVRVTARDGIVVAGQEDRNRFVYRVRNEDASARTLVIEHPVRTGWTRVGEPEPEEVTASSARYLLPVGARAEAELVVTERRATESRVSIGQFDDGVIASFAQRGVSAEALRAALQPVFDARAEVAAAERLVNDLAARIAAIARDQERVRENMKALGNSREERALLQRYTRELGAQEDRLADLQAQVAAATVDRNARQAELARLVQELTFDIDVR